jgi:hypothetical protein
MYVFNVSYPDRHLLSLLLSEKESTYTPAHPVNVFSYARYRFSATGQSDKQTDHYYRQGHAPHSRHSPLFHKIPGILRFPVFAYLEMQVRRHILSCRIAGFPDKSYNVAPVDFSRRRNA